MERCVSLKLLLLYLFALVLEPSHGSIKSISEGVESLLKLQGKPFRVSFMICNSTVETELSIKVNSMTYFGGDFKPIDSGGGQEATFIIVDLKCPAHKIQEALSSSNLYIVYSRFLVLDSDDTIGAIKNEAVLQSVLVKTPIAQCTELFYFHRQKAPEMLFLKQAFKRFKVDNSTVILENYGEVLEDGQFRNLRQLNVTPIRRKDLQGVDFLLPIILENPDSINHLDDYVDSVVDPLTKNTLRLVRVVAGVMNVRPVLTINNIWGNSYPPANNWTGTIGILQSGQSEFSGSPFLVRASRLEAIDYLCEAIRSYTKIVLRAPKLSYTTNVFLLPFDKFVWGFGILLLAFIVCLLSISTWNEWNILVPAKEIEPGRDMLTPRFSDSLFLVLGNAFVQGSPTAPRSTAGRIIVLFCLIFLVCLYVSYSAFIIALLQSPSNSIKTVSDLLNSQIEVGNQDTTYFRFWLPKETDAVEKELFEKRIMNKDGTDNFIDLEKGVEKLRKGLYALHMEAPIGYRLVVEKFTEHEKCDLREIPYGNFRGPYFACRKHSVFKEFLRIMTLRIKESGVQVKLWREIYVMKPKCTQQGNFMPLALMDLRPVIYTYIGGVCLSLGVFVAEILTYKYNKRAIAGRETNVYLK